MKTRMAGSSDLSRYKRKECAVRGSFTADWDMAASTRQVRKARRSKRFPLSSPSLRVMAQRICRPTTLGIIVPSLAFRIRWSAVDSSP